MERKETSFKGYIISAVVVALVVVTSYFYQFGVYPLSIENTDWGTFGDFVGGTLNPFFAFMAFLALLTTIKIQSNELELTREELAKSSLALESQSESFKIQNDSIKQQNFENTFFNMLKLHNEIVDKLILTQVESNHSTFIRVLPGLEIPTKTYHGKDVITQLLNNLKKSLLRFDIKQNPIESIEGKFNDKYDEIISQYFGFIYQILKFINESDIENKKKYASLFRSLFSQAELELLFYHCMGYMGSVNFKPLLEKYNFLEHLKYSKKQLTLELALDYYDKNVFGENIFWTLEYSRCKL